MTKSGKRIIHAGEDFRSRYPVEQFCHPTDLGMRGLDRLRDRIYSIKLHFEIETENKSRSFISIDIYHSAPQHCSFV
jgi:hypothetical protein